VRTQPLGQLKKGQKGKITSTGGEPEMNRRFLEMGLLEGSVVEIVHVAPFSGDPIAIRIRGSLIAMRRVEANHIEVSVSVGAER
jgi:Fe2+ transport system protein FeoA